MKFITALSVFALLLKDSEDKQVRMKQQGKCVC